MGIWYVIKGRNIRKVADNNGEGAANNLVRKCSETYKESNRFINFCKRFCNDDGYKMFCHRGKLGN